MARSNAITYASRRSNHAESSTAGARRAVQAESDRDRTDSEGGSASEDDQAEFQSRPTQGTAQTGTQAGAAESHQSRAAANMKAGMGSTAYERLVSETINMALYATQRRQAIKKDDINKKILSKKTAIWPAVLADAQLRLREVFGMELVELRSAGQGDPTLRETVDTNETQVQGKGKKRANDADDAAEAPAKKKAASGSKSWILRSTLPPELIAAMNMPNEIVSRGEDEENHPAIRDCGALLHWDKGDGIAGGGVALKGILFTLLALILVRDRSISDSRFMKELEEKLNLHSETILPFAAKDSPIRSIKFSEFLALLVRQNYLQKVKIQGVVGDVGAGHETQYEWRWGSRADAEIGEKAVSEFMLDIAEDDDAATNEQLDAAQRKKEKQEKALERKRLKSAIESAAGSALQDVTPT
ncbi:hypothetical protein FFLO_00999 [Filobasidium floriforme]|uniref:MAGE domain-containing protein n=1 Tax=Filobasidium floriforme TaxID=5210 RepID=A0A8K0JQF0_9TREE|nr:hypothetical protein FFLO_00999 [Filobasidium floriforme]